MNICIKLAKPFIIVVTKCDILKLNTSELKNKLLKLESTLIEKTHINVKLVESKQINYLDYIPIIGISNITGENYDILHDILYHLPVKEKEKYAYTSGTNFMINNIFYIQEVGIVVAGILESGIIKLNDRLLLGPYNNTFFNVKIISIHKKQIPTNELLHGEPGSLVINFSQKNKINKHMRIIDTSLIKDYTNKFYIKFNNIELEKLANFKNGVKLMAFINNTYDRIRLFNCKKYESYTIYEAKFKRNDSRFLNDFDDIAIRYSDIIIFGKCFKNKSLIS